MSRTVKRVPLDFDWPVGEVWSGYRMPDSLNPEPCPAGPNCIRGGTAARAWVATIAHVVLRVANDTVAQQREQPMDTELTQVAPRTDDELCLPIRPSPDFAEFAAALAGPPTPAGFHIDVDGAADRIISAVGLDPGAWGLCPACGGAGTVDAYPGQSAERDAWKGQEPAAGDGWQLWETVTQGSPVSPVFATADELARWLTTAEGGHAAGARRPMTLDQARGFVAAGGTAATGYITAGGMHDGPTYTGTEHALRHLIDDPAEDDREEDTR